MDYYFSKDHGKSQDKIYHLLIVRVYIELSLIIPLKPRDLLEIKVGELRNEAVRTIVHNSISIQLPKSVRTHIIESIDFAEKQYNAKYSEKDSLFIFLVLLLFLLLTARNNLLHLALFCQDAIPNTHSTNPRNPLQNRAFRGKSRRNKTMIKVLFICHGRIYRA